jgi:2-polyprenyl-3-methyl-5-hydroxy-6-metoxy-1,4-benzoquinol methylase
MKWTCTICGNRVVKIIIKNAKAIGGQYDIYYCDQCMVGKTTPVLPPEDLEKLYSEEIYRSKNGKRFHGPIEKLIYIWRLQRKKRIEKHAGKGKILDIGCGRGLFLDIMRTYGWTVKGVEFGQAAVENASSAYGIDVISETRMQNELPDEEFDVITMNHVLEHVYDPVETIHECSRTLKYGGLLVVSVPNILSLQASFGNQDWFHLDPPYHLHHFSEQGLTKLLENHSFSIRKVRRFDWEYDIFGWLQTLLNRAGIRKNLFYDSLKMDILRKKQLPVRTRWGLFWTFMLLPVFAPLALILSLVESYLLHKGGTIEIYATKSGDLSG